MSLLSFVQDLWTHTDNGTAVRNFTAKHIPPHGVVALLLKDAGDEPAGLYPPVQCLDRMHQPEWNARWWKLRDCKAISAYVRSQGGHVHIESLFTVRKTHQYVFLVYPK